MIVRKLIFALTACMLLGSPVLAQTTRPAADKPTRVTVKVQDASVPEAIKAFAKATGISMNLQLAGNESNTNRVTLDHTDSPFLVVMEDLMSQGGLMPAMSGNGHSLAFNNAREPLSIQKPDPTTLLIVHGVRLEGSVSMKPDSKPRYVYNFMMTVILDPARQIVCVGQRPFIDDLVYPNSDFRKSGDGYVWMQRVDARPCSVFNVELGFNSDERIAKLDRIDLRFRAWQSAEQKTATIKGAMLLEGGEVINDGITLSSTPPQEDGTIKLKITGEPIGMYRSPPWNNAIASLVRIEGIDGPMGEMRSDFIPRGNQPDAEIHIGGESIRTRIRHGKPQSTDDIESVTVSIPTKIRQIDLPMSLKEIPLP